MLKEYEEIYKAIGEINDELYEKYGDDNNTLLTMTVNYCYSFINLTIGMFEFSIYCSEDDDRIFFERLNRYENWKTYIKRKFKAIKAEINKVKL